MTELYEIIVDVKTGQQTARPFTPEEVIAHQTAAAIASVPVSVTPRQVRLLLLSQGLLSHVTGLIEKQDEATKIAWEYASEFRRNDSLLLSLATELNLTSQQLDAFFIAAAAL